MMNIAHCRSLITYQKIEIYGNQVNQKNVQPRSDKLIFP